MGRERERKRQRGRERTTERERERERDRECVCVCVKSNYYQGLSLNSDKSTSKASAERLLYQTT